MSESERDPNWSKKNIVFFGLIIFFVVCMLVETLNIHYVCRELKEDKSHFVFLPFERNCNYTNPMMDKIGDIVPRNEILDDDWRGD